MTDTTPPSGQTATVSVGMRRLGLTAMANDLDKGFATVDDCLAHVNARIERLERAGTVASDHAPGTVGEADAMRRGVWCDRARTFVREVWKVQS